MQTNLNQIAKDCHNAALNKGFYDRENDMLTLAKDKPESFKQWLRAAFTTQRLMLLVTEASEAVESLRKFKFAQRQVFENRIKEDQPNYNQHFNHAYQCHMKDTFETEIAGLMLRLFDICGRENIDIDYYLKREIEFNATRERMNGKEF